MNLKTKQTLILMLFFSISIFAQENYVLKGTVVAKDSDTAIPGVNVVVKNSTTGAVTDFDGKYEVNVKNGDVLQFSFLGFLTVSQIVAGQKTLDVVLQEDSASLDEVVVLGYGTQKKSHLTGAISKVVNDDLEQIAVSRVDDALVGQVAGVNIQATEGEAGSDPTIRIRGTGSITGDSAPAIVVDGIVVDSDFLGSLDMNNVESFEVLKDAASSAIFGSRGGNGVIIITTKQGKIGKTKFSYNTFTGFKEARQSDAYALTVKETADAQLAALGSVSNRTRYKQLLGIDNPWQNIIFDGGTIISHAISARGGSEKTRFSSSFNYSHDEGVLITDDFKKYGIDLKVDTEVTDKLSFGAKLSPSYTNRKRFDGSTHDILRQPSWLPVRHDANTIRYVDRAIYPDVQIGDYAVQRHFDNYDLFGDGSELVDISNTSNTNPAAKILERDRKDLKFKMFGSFYGKYKITDGLSFRAALSGDFQNTKRTRWQGVLANRNGASAAQLDIQSINRIHILSDNYISFDKAYGNHEINAVAGFSAEEWDTSVEAVRGTGYDSDLLKTISAATTLALGNSAEFEERLLSYFARMNYAYDDRYLASVSLRQDGSSIFGLNNKYGFFPAFSVGWNIANEGFLRDSDIVNTLKFRFSYGFTGNKSLDTGNDLIDLYPSISLIGNSTGVIDGNLVSGSNPLNIANPDLQWERSREINPAVDFGFLNNRISGSVDYYNRTSDQLLLFSPISVTTGFRNALFNRGEVVNKGVEVELRTKNIVTTNFNWSTTFLFSKNENELTNFGDANGQIQNVDDKRAAEWINLEGNPISSYYGWVVDKEIPLEFIKDPYHPIGATAQDVYVKDLNGDGVIDDDDKTILGNPYPDFVWSITNDFKVHNFDISFMFQGSQGAEIRNLGDQYIFNQFNSAQDFIASTPNQGFIREKIFTNDQIQDASYIALRNVNVGYTFSSNTLSKIGFFTKARIYASGQNLMYLTADNYTGFNPESINDTSSTTFGYQRAGSPVFRTISMGLNLEF